METPPQSPFLLGIYEVPDTRLASPPGDPQLALDHIPASWGGPRGDARTQCSLQSDLLTAPAQLCPKIILAEPRVPRWAESWTAKERQGESNTNNNDQTLCDLTAAPSAAMTRVLRSEVTQPE